MGFFDRLKKKSKNGRLKFYTPEELEKMSDEDLAKMVEENTIPMYDDSHMDLEKGIPAKYVRTKITIPANVLSEIMNRKGLDYLNPLKRKKKARERPETIVEWHKKGKTFSLSKNYEEAMKCFDKALELDPNVANSWFNKGQVFMHLENYEEAMHCFVKALELNHNHLDASFHLALILVRQGRKEESMKCLLHVIEFIERNVALPEIGAFDMLKPEERFYIQLLIDALNNQGHILGTLGRDTEALICFERISELDPNDVFGINAKNVINEIHQRINS